MENIANDVFCSNFKMECFVYVYNSGSNTVDFMQTFKHKFDFVFLIYIGSQGRIRQQSLSTI